MRKSIFNWILILSSIVIIFFLYSKIDYKYKNISEFTNLAKCLDLKYEDQKLNSINNFGSFKIKLKILNERRWKEILITNEVLNYENKSYTYDPGYINAELILENNFGLKCILDAEIKPHGDLTDHFVNFKQGANIIYDLPSLKVKLIDGNINGIVEFRLFKPKTRNYINEIFATTFLEFIGLYAPRSARIEVEYNNKLSEFIFQEKINKEFLENNKLIEGPIYSGDERFVFKYNEDLQNSLESGISKHKLTDSKWANLNSTNNKLALKVLEFLNITNHFYSSEVNQVMFVDYFTSTKKSSEPIEFFSNLPVFDAISFAIGSTHNLSRDDRRFYYDLTNKKFVPIYYDGMVSIFDINDSLIVKNNKFDMSLNNWINHMGNGKILNSAVVGSIKAKEILQKINISDLKKLLDKRGANISIIDLEKTIKIIKNNLLILSSVNESRIIIAKNEQKNSLINFNAIKKKINAKYLFKDLDNNFKICNLKLENCKNIMLDKKQLSLIPDQKLKYDNDSEIIFMGNLKNFQNNKNLINILNDKLKYVETINNNTFIKTYGEVEVEIIDSLKKINFKKKSIDGRILITGGEISDWDIFFEDSSKKNEFFERRDSNGLSGCLNFYDIKVKNIKIMSNNSLCEDSVNFVRTSGTLNNIEVKNSSYDAVDFDFSDLKIENAKIVSAGNDCIDFSYGVYNLLNAQLDKCGDKALSIGENSKLLSNTINIKNSNIGIATKDSSVSNFSNIKMNNLKFCISVYKKKQEFNGGLLIIDNISCENFVTLKEVDNYSKIIINNPT